MQLYTMFDYQTRKLATVRSCEIDAENIENERLVLYRTQPCITSSRPLQLAQDM